MNLQARAERILDAGAAGTLLVFPEADGIVLSTMGGPWLPPLRWTLVAVFLGFIAAPYVKPSLTTGGARLVYGLIAFAVAFVLAVVDMAEAEQVRAPKLSRFRHGWRRLLLAASAGEYREGVQRRIVIDGREVASALEEEVCVLAFDRYFKGPLAETILQGRIYAVVLVTQGLVYELFSARSEAAAIEAASALASTYRGEETTARVRSCPSMTRGSLPTAWVRGVLVAMVLVIAFGTTLQATVAMLVWLGSELGLAELEARLFAMSRNGIVVEVLREYEAV